MTNTIKISGLKMRVRILKSTYITLPESAAHRPSCPGIEFAVVEQRTFIKMSNSKSWQLLHPAYFSQWKNDGNKCSLSVNTNGLVSYTYQTPQHSRPDKIEWKLEYPGDESQIGYTILDLPWGAHMLKPISPRMLSNKLSQSTFDIPLFDTYDEAQKALKYLKRNNKSKTRTFDDAVIVKI